jgi:hypothetical protein
LYGFLGKSQVHSDTKACANAILINDMRHFNVQICQAQANFRSDGYLRAGVE